MKKLGKWLRSQRKKAGISQVDLAKKANYEISQIVSNTERGKNKPPIPLMIAYIENCNISKESMIKEMLACLNRKLKKELWRI